MAIKAGQILHAMNRTVVDRIQTAGAGNLNIPTEKIYELGNYQTVATVRDIPDLSFNLDCLDVDTEVESLLTGHVDPKADVFGDGSSVDAETYDLLTNSPVDIVSPWKSRQGKFDIVRAVGIPQLTLEQASYRYGLQENAGETFTLRGDSIFYIPGNGYLQVETGDGVITDFDLMVTYPPPDGHDAVSQAVLPIEYVEAGESMYALSVSVNGERLVPGDDYEVVGMDTATPTTPVQISFTDPPADQAVIKIMYGFDPADLPGGEDLWPQAVNAAGALAVKPAAIRGKDIDLYVAVSQADGTFTNSGTAAPSRADFRRWTDVQSFNVDWRVTIEDDFEFGNPRAVNRDYTDAPEVTGSAEFRHRSPEKMFEKLQDITGVPADQVIGPQSTRTVQVMLELRNPEGHGTDNEDVPDGPTAGSKIGAVLKTLYVPDARFVLPGYEGRVQQKLNQTMNFDSDGGILRVFKGAPRDGQFLTDAGVPAA